MPPLPRPDAEYITQLRDHLHGVWSETHAHWEVIDSWYHKTVFIWPEHLRSRSQYLPSTARAVIDVAADTQLSFEPHLHRNPVSVGRRHERWSDEVEAGLFHVIMDSQLQETELPFKACGKNLGKYGYGVLKGPIEDYGEYPEEPVRDDYDSDEEYGWAVVDYENAKKKWNPIRFSAPNPATVLMDPARKQPPEAIEWTWMSGTDITEILEAAKARKRNKPDFVDMSWVPPSNRYEPIETVIYWSAKWHGMVLNSKLILLEKNAWGFQPLRHAFAGFGSQPVNRKTRGSNPRYLAEGLLDGVMDGLKAEGQAMSAKQNAIIERSYLRWRTAGDTAQLEEQLADDAHAISAEKDEVDFIKYPELERSLFQAGQEIVQDIRQGTFTSDVGGVRQVGVSTVGQQAMLLVNANKKFASVSKQLDYMASGLASDILKLVNRLDEKLMVGGHELSKAKIDNDYFIVAEFRQIDPVLQQQARELGLREVEGGGKSWETYWESDLQIANVSLERERLIKQKVRETLPYFEVMAERIAHEDGMDEAFRRWKQAQTGAAPEPAPTNGRLTPEAGGTITEAMGNAIPPQRGRP